MLDNSQGIRMVGSLNNNDIIMKPFKDFISTDSKCQDPSSIGSYKLSNLHGSAFVDLNMDCRPDLFVESRNVAGDRVVETYFFNDTDKFCLVSVNIFTEQVSSLATSSFSFIDLFRKGSNHAVAIDGDNKINIMVNKYNLPNPKDTASSLCLGKEMLGSDNKHIAPFDGFKEFGKTFTKVSLKFIFKIIFLIIFVELLFLLARCRSNW
jgi:hypothetical protein